MAANLVILDQNIANAIAVEMQKKGYIQGDKNSDLMLDFHIILKEDGMGTRRGSSTLGSL